MSSENVSDNNVILSEDTKNRDITVTEDITKITQFPFTTPITNCYRVAFCFHDLIIWCCNVFGEELSDYLYLYYIYLGFVAKSTKATSSQTDKLWKCALDTFPIIGNLSVDFAFWIYLDKITNRWSQNSEKANNLSKNYSLNFVDAEVKLN